MKTKTRNRSKYSSVSRVAKRRWGQKHRAIFGSTLLVLAVFGLFAAISHLRADAAGVPFPKGQGLVFVSQGDPTRLYESLQVPGTNTANFTPVGPVQSITYNALGFNPTDMYLYAINVDTNHLIQIDSTGATTSVTSAAIPNLPKLSGQQTYNAGSIGTCDYPTLNVLWVAPSTGTSTLYGINVNTAQIVKTVSLSQPLPNVADFVCMKDTASGNNYIWAVYGGGGSSAAAPNGIYRINLQTGETDLFSLAALTTIQWNGAAFGAQWLYGNGNIGISNNTTGNIHQIIIENPTSASPTFSEAVMLHGPASTTNDGASYPGAPVDLSIVKTVTTDYGEFGPDDDNDQYSPGANLDFKLTVTNNSVDVASSGFYITDTLDSIIDPATVTFGTDECYISGTNSLGQTIIACGYGTLNPGASVSFDMYVSAPLSVPSSVTNTATVYGNEQDPDDTNNTSSATTSAAPTAYVISKAASAPADVRPGNTLTYTITVTNTGDDDYTAGGIGLATFTDDLSDVLDDATLDLPLASGLVQNGTSLSWSGELLVGETIEVEYSVTINDPETGNLAVNNTVVADGIQGGCADICSTHNVVGIPAYSINKAVDKTAVTPNGTTPNDWVTYTITVTNTGTSPYTASDPITIEDDLSDVMDDAVYTGTISATVGNASISGTILNWSGPLGIGESATISYMVRVNVLRDNTAQATMTNNVAATGDHAGEATCITCSVQTDLTAPVLKISTSTYTVNPDGSATWTITAKNASDIAVPNVTATIIADALTTTPWTTNTTTGSLGSITAGTATDNNILPWNIGDMTAGQTSTMTITIPKSDVTWDSDICITATIGSFAVPYTGDYMDRTDNQANNNNVDADTDQWDYNGYYPTVLKVSVSTYTVNPDGSVTWTVTAKNASTGTATDVTATIIADALTTEPWTVVTSTGTTGAIAPGTAADNNILPWSIGDMASGQVETLTITVPGGDLTWDGDICITAIIGNDESPYTGDYMNRAADQANNNNVDADTDQWDYNGYYPTPVADNQSPEPTPNTPETGAFGASNHEISLLGSLGVVAVVAIAVIWLTSRKNSTKRL
jgi:uncharacterized repeat protein (TIGR01451 family)